LTIAVLRRRERADESQGRRNVIRESIAAGSGGGIPGSSRVIRLRQETKRSRALGGALTPAARRNGAETSIGKQVLQGIAG
jgi:hypothetical protein